jgi:hypothetical protein
MEAKMEAIECIQRATWRDAVGHTSGRNTVHG